jgi:phage FluMu protein gp41
MYPPQPNYGKELMFQSLAAVWRIYRERGARRLLVARVIEHDCERAEYRSAVPGAEVTVCRLIAPVGLMQTRLHIREVGSNHDSDLARSTELDGILNDAAVEDVTVENDGTRSVSDVALELLTKANWL